MAEFKSAETTIGASAEQVYDKLSDLGNLQSFLDKIPEDKIPADKMEQFKNLEITKDSISITGGPMGSVKLDVVERVRPSLVKLKAANIPLSLTLAVSITAIDDAKCTTQVVIDTDIPAILKPMVGGPLQQIADQFSIVMVAIPFND